MRELLGNRLFIFLFLPILILLAAIAIYFAQRESRDITLAKQYPLVSRRVFVEKPNDLIINLVPLRTQLEEYVAKNGKDTIGLYFEYLPSGVSVGVNDQLTTNVASLLKVPLAMAIYHQIELSNMQLNDSLTIEAKYLDDRSGDVWKRGANAQISVKEAIEESLIRSDNTASSVLLANLPKGGLENVFDFLDIPKIKDGAFIVLSPFYYSSVLRSLYLAAYLNPAHSNEVLDILSRTKFTSQIPSGVGDSVKVAHKVGEYEIGTTQTITHSDCGIIYIPQRPYILCLMTKLDRPEADKHMSELSRIIYKYIKNAE